jgi:hypothetical protein
MLSTNESAYSIAGPTYTHMKVSKFDRKWRLKLDSWRLKLRRAVVDLSTFASP